MVCSHTKYTHTHIPHPTQTRTTTQYLDALNELMIGDAFEVGQEALLRRVGHGLLARDVRKQHAAPRRIQIYVLKLCL